MMDQIKIAFQQSELDYLDTIEALQKECGMTGKEAEALVEVWDEGPSAAVGEAQGSDK